MTSVPSRCTNLSLAHREQVLTTLLSARQVSDIGVCRQRRSNLPTGLNLSDLNQTVSGLGDGLADGLGGLGLTLGADDVGLALLLSTLDNEARTLSILLSNLLLLNSLGELATKGHVCDGDVLKSNVELGGAGDEVVTDAVGNSLSLGDELGSVKLSNDGLEDLVADRGENSLIVVDAEVLCVVEC